MGGSGRLWKTSLRDDYMIKHAVTRSPPFSRNKICAVLHARRLSNEIGKKLHKPAVKSPLTTVVKFKCFEFAKKYEYFAAELWGTFYFLYDLLVCTTVCGAYSPCGKAVRKKI